MGVAEDGVTCYYVAANRPDVAAISIHTIFEYGDPGGVHWQGPPWLVKLKAAGLAVGSRARPTYGIPAAEGIPFDDVFGGPDDAAYIEMLKNDPLALHEVEFRFMHSLIMGQPAPVPFEECRTPVQVIASEANQIWPYEMVVRNFTRLGGPKELITLPQAPQWDTRREFNENYSAEVIRWFRANRGLPDMRPTIADLPVFDATVTSKTMVLPAAARGFLTLTGGGEPEVFELVAGGATRIGRDPANEIRLDRPLISRYHAQVIEEEGTFAITDLHSTNGVYVNDERIPAEPGRRSLSHGDQVRLADTEFLFELRVPTSGPAPNSA
jgi:hypothetical protein